MKEQRTITRNFYNNNPLVSCDLPFLLSFVCLVVYAKAYMLSDFNEFQVTSSIDNNSFSESRFSHNVHYERPGFR